MLYQFLDLPADTSIQQIIRKRSRVVDSIVVFMTNYDHNLYQQALSIGYNLGEFTFINLLGTGHLLGDDNPFALDDLVDGDSGFQLIKKDD